MKKKKIYMPNANQSLAYPKRSIFHGLALGLTLDAQQFVLGLRQFALGPQGFSDTRMLVSAHVGSLTLEAPIQCVFAKWWNISFMVSSKCFYIAINLRLK